MIKKVFCEVARFRFHCDAKDFLSNYKPDGFWTRKRVMNILNNEQKLSVWYVIERLEEKLFK